MRERPRSLMKSPSKERQRGYSGELSGTSFTSSPSPEDTRLCESTTQSRAGRARVVGNDFFPRAEDLSAEMTIDRAAEGDGTDDDRDEGRGNGGSSQPARRTQDPGGAHRRGAASRWRGFQQHFGGVSYREDTLESEEGDGGDEESALEDEVGGRALVRRIEDAEDYVEGEGELDEGELEEEQDDAEEEHGDDDEEEEHGDHEEEHEEDQDQHDDDEEELDGDEEEHYDDEEEHNDDEEERIRGEEDLRDLVKLGVDCGEDADGDGVNQGLPDAIRTELFNLKLSVRDYEDCLAELYGTRDRSEWRGRVRLMADLAAADSQVYQLENEVGRLRKELRSSSRDPNRGPQQGSDNDFVIERDRYKVLVADLRAKLSGLEEDNRILAQAAGWELDPSEGSSAGEEEEAKSDGKPPTKRKKRLSRQQARRMAAIELMRTRLTELAQRVLIAEQEAEAARVAAEDSAAERDVIMARSNELLAAARHFKRGKAVAEARAEALMNENQELKGAEEAREQLVLEAENRAEEFRRRSEASRKELEELAYARRMADRLAEEVAARAEGAENTAEALREELEELKQARGAAEETAEEAAAKALEAEKGAEEMRAEIAELKNAQRHAERLMEDAAAEVAEAECSAEDLRDEIKGLRNAEQSARRLAEQAAARAAEAEGVVNDLKEELQELKDARQSARMEVDELRKVQEAAVRSAKQAATATAEVEDRADVLRMEAQELRDGQRSAREEIDRLRDARQAAEAAAEQAATAIAESEGRAEALNEEVQELRDAQRLAREEIEGLREARESAARSAEAAAAETVAAEGRVGVLTEEIQELRQAQQAARQEIEGLRNAQQASGRSMEQATATTEQAQDRAEALRVEVEELRDAHQSATEELEGLRDAQQAARRLMEQAVAATAEAEGTAETLRLEVQELRDAQNSAREEIEGLEDRQEAARFSVEQAMSATAEAEGRAEVLKEEVQELRNAQQLAREEIEGLRSARQAARLSAEQATAATAEAKGRAEVLRDEMHELRDSHQEAERSAKLAAVKTAEAESRVGRLKQELEDLKNAHQAARRSAEEAKAEVARAKRRTEALQEELEGLRSTQQASEKAAAEEAAATMGSKQEERGDATQLGAVTDRIARLEADLQRWREACLRADEQLRRETDLAGATNRMLMERDASMQDLIAKLSEAGGDPSSREDPSIRSVTGSGRDSMQIQSRLSCTRECGYASLAESASITTEGSRGGSAPADTRVSAAGATRSGHTSPPCPESAPVADPLDIPDSSRRFAPGRGVVTSAVELDDAAVGETAVRTGISARTTNLVSPQEGDVPISELNYDHDSEDSPRSLQRTGVEAHEGNSGMDAHHGMFGFGDVPAESTTRMPAATGLGLSERRGGQRTPAEVGCDPRGATQDEYRRLGRQSRGGSQEARSQDPRMESAPASVFPTTVDRDGDSVVGEGAPGEGAATGATGTGQYDQLPRGDVLRFTTSSLEESGGTVSSAGQDRDLIHNVDDGTAHPLAADSSAETVADGVCFDMPGTSKGRTSGVPASMKADARSGQRQVEVEGNSQEELDAAPTAKGPGKPPTLEANSATILEQTEDRAAAGEDSPGWRGESIGSDASGLERALPTVEDETASTAELAAQERTERAARSAEHSARQAQGSASQARVHRAAAEASEQRAASEATMIRDAAVGLTAAPMHGLFRAPQHQQKHQQARDERQEEAVRRAKRAARLAERAAMAARLERLAAETAAEAANSAERFVTGVLDRGRGESPVHFIHPWRGGQQPIYDERLKDVDSDTAQGGDFQSRGMYALGRDYEARRGEKIGEEEDEDEVGGARSTEMRHEGVSIPGGRASEEGHPTRRVTWHRPGSMAPADAAETVATQAGSDPPQDRGVASGGGSECAGVPHILLPGGASASVHPKVLVTSATSQTLTPPDSEGSGGLPSSMQGKVGGMAVPAPSPSGEEKEADEEARGVGISSGAMGQHLGGGPHDWVMEIATAPESEGAEAKAEIPRRSSSQSQDYDPSQQPREYLRRGRHGPQGSSWDGTTEVSPEEGLCSAGGREKPFDSRSPAWEYWQSPVVAANATREASSKRTAGKRPQPQGAVGSQPAVHRRQSVGLDGDPGGKGWDGRPPAATRGRSRDNVQKVTDGYRSRSQSRRRSQTRPEDPPLDFTSGGRGAGGITPLRRISQKASGGIGVGVSGRSASVQGRKKRTATPLNSSVGVEKQAKPSRHAGVCARVCANPTCPCGEAPDPVALAAWHARHRRSMSGRAR